MRNIKINPLVSVVIPTKNRAYILGETIESLLKQTYTNIEIIVVDDCSTDKTQQLVYEIQKRSGKKIIFLQNEKNKGPAASRNRGVKESKGEIIFFTDSDCFVPKDWLEKIIKEYKDKEIVGVGGYLKPDTNNWVGKLENLQNKYLLHIGNKKIKGNEKCPVGYTNSMTYKKDVLEKAGGFNENFKFPSGEDIDLKKRICSKGAKLVFVPAPIMHLDEYNLDYLLNRFIIRGLNKDVPKNKIFKIFYVLFMFPLIVIKIIIKIIKYKLQRVI